MADKEMYLVSFGDSSKYITGKGEMIKNVTEKLKEQLKKLFPGAGIIPEPQVEKITDSARYKDYPELDLKAIPAILKTLATGQRDKVDLKSLNNNAPWSNIF